MFVSCPSGKGALLAGVEDVETPGPVHLVLNQTGVESAGDRRFARNRRFVEGGRGCAACSLKLPSKTMVYAMESLPSPSSALVQPLPSVLSCLTQLSFMSSHLAQEGLPC